MTKKIDLAEQARDTLLGLRELIRQAPAIHQKKPSQLEGLARAMDEAASDLNGAAHRLRRLAKQMNKSGAAGAVHDTRK